MENQTDPRITQADLKDWFGEEMPLSVFRFLFVDAPSDMTIGEIKKSVVEMAEDFRSPPELSRQAFAIMADLKKNGNLAPVTVQKINAWEARFLRWSREEDARNAVRAREREELPSP